MIFGVIIDSLQVEGEKILQYLHEVTAYCSDEVLRIDFFQSHAQLDAHLQKEQLLDLVIVDITVPGALEKVRQIRRQYPETEIMVIADMSVSPMKYIHPTVRASGLILRPESPEWRSALKDFLSQLLLRDEEDEGAVWVENRDGRLRIPWRQIYYIEAREKKLFIRTRAEEIPSSGTLEKMLETLPDCFARCHRSYIVNKMQISRIRANENLIYLRDDMLVPVSRSYRAILKEGAS